MPELPDIEVIKEFLDTHIAGQTIAAVEHVGPIVVRNLLGGDAAALLEGRTIASAARRGKFLLLRLNNGPYIMINFMLSGRLHYEAPRAKPGVKTFLVLALSSGMRLRYSDATQMGKVYLTDDLARVPTLSEQGPDALAPEVTLDVFRQRLKRHTGEIKGALVNLLPRLPAWDAD